MTVPTPPRRIYLVEDHTLMREVVREYLGAIPGLEVCGESDSAEGALDALAEAGPDLLVVDTSLPKMSGIDLVKAVQTRWSALPCIVLSGHGQERHVEEALEAGARGYVLKGDPTELPRAIERVLGGEDYVSPRLGWSPQRSEERGAPPG